MFMMALGGIINYWWMCQCCASPNDVENLKFCCRKYSFAAESRSYVSLF